MCYSIAKTKVTMGEVLKEAALGLAEATFTMGNFNQQVLNDVDASLIRIRSKKDNVAGNLSLCSHRPHLFRDSSPMLAP